MKISSLQRLSPSAASGILVFVHSNALSRIGSSAPEKTLGQALAQAVKNTRFAAGQEEKLALFWNNRPVLVCGLGEEKDLGDTAFRIAVRHALSHEHLSSCKEVQVLPPSGTDAAARAIAEGAVIGTYAWDKYMAEKGGKVKAYAKHVRIYNARAALLAEVEEIDEGMKLTRDLVNENAGITTSLFLEKAVRDTVKGAKSVDLKVIDEKQMTKLGMNLFLAVNRGSLNPPRLIIARYKGGKANEKYTALVGKGITFDSGGLNLKGTGKIEDMKLDMAGSAALLGVLKNVLRFKPRRNLLFAFCLAENAIDAAAGKPGDVVTGYAGKSVEIANTDAEGRLILADANAYVTKNYQVETLINIATLTGAVLIALGQDHTGLMSDDDALAQSLLDCGRQTNDPAWRLPIYPELAKYIKSRVADLRNVALPQGQAGTVTAGAFLRQFVPQETGWAHLDIAGTAYINQAEHGYYGAGATGAGVRLLTAFVRGANAKKKK